MTERRAPTFWRANREGQVKTQNEDNREIGTHQLETALRRANQDTERMRASKVCSRPEIELEEISENTERMRQRGGTNDLETALGEEIQKTERMRPSEGHSQT